MISCSSGFVTFHLKKAGDSASAEKPPENTTSAELSANTKEGYLRLLIDASFSGGNIPERPEGYSYLAVTLENPDGLEFPVMLYSFEKGEKEQVSGLEMGKSSYIHLLSRNPGSFKIHARAIPDSFAASYAAAVRRFGDTVSLIPISELSGQDYRIAVAAAILTELSKLIEKEGEKIWHTEETIGLSGKMSEALNSDAIIAFMIPESSGKSDEILSDIRGSEFVPCGSDVKFEVCKKDQSIPYSAVPYFVIRAGLSDYRPMSEVAPSIDCSRSEEDFTKIDNAIRSTRITHRQRTSERRLADELRILLDLKNEKDTGIDKLAEYINRLIARSTSSDDEYWNRYYGEKSESIRQCVKDEIASRGLKERVWYEVIERAITASMQWDDKIKDLNSNDSDTGSSRTPDEERIKILEEALLDIATPIEKFNLSNGPVYDFLIMEKMHIERILRKLDDRMRKAIASGEIEKDKALAILTKRLESTSCETCRPVLEAAFSDLKMVDATASLEKAQAQLLERQSETARLHLQLASLRREASQLVRIVESRQLPVEGGAESIENSLTKSRQILASDDGLNDPERLNSAIKEIEESVKPARAILASLDE